MLFACRACVSLVLAALVSAQGSPTEYAPYTGVQCPDISASPLVRTFTPETQSLHPQEASYVNSRYTNILPAAWNSWLGNGSAIGYDMSQFQGKFPKVGVAISGGGYRAAQYGAAVLSALDSRNDTALTSGTGGLLQVASYLTGLSGGSLNAVSVLVSYGT